MSTQSHVILEQLKSLRNPRNIVGMARFGINPRNTLGVSIPTLRRIAKQAGKDHRLARELWQSGIHEARILAAMVDVPEQVTDAQMERWVKDFDSWDVCDQVCSNLFDQTAFAHRKAVEWSRREEEFVKRAGFVLMAALAVHDKAASDAAFLKFLPIIQRAATDERNFVMKAVNWALRQIGKRNAALNRAAIATAREIQQIDSRAARWIAADALRELKQCASKPTTRA
ncbi:MAG: DNA alkylation repair protein [Chloroflexota bacterium]|nr:DNA alkylation repair protein [Chloroflexota bacterium]